MIQTSWEGIKSYCQSNIGKLYLLLCLHFTYLVRVDSRAVTKVIKSLYRTKIKGEKQKRKLKNGVRRFLLKSFPSSPPTPAHPL